MAGSRTYWAVDAEPDMTDVVRAKATAAGAAYVRTVTAGAEELHARPATFELIVIGNAFHRLRRTPVAQRALAWLKPGGCLALCWSTSPWAGSQDWQRALDSKLQAWHSTLGASGRVPSGWDKGGRTLTVPYWPVPGSRPPDVIRSPSSITGRSANSPGSSGRRRSCRPPCSRSTPPSSTRT
ncbi:class I SAM-dependent methyltransferase [Streptomyces sp. NPDC058475]|uniref:class I SAM-dependent methyltransferase n=1 Tax=Streptomyces sp. NPDC058475 TaxID=3346518 RepID=UPI0036467EAB